MVLVVCALVFVLPARYALVISSFTAIVLMLMALVHALAMAQSSPGTLLRRFVMRKGAQSAATPENGLQLYLQVAQARAYLDQATRVEVDQFQIVLSGLMGPQICSL